MTDDAAPAAIGNRRRLLHTALTGLSQGIGFLGVAVREISLGRVAGAVLLLAGALLVRLY